MISRHDEPQIMAAIQAAEKLTSGEIMLHTERSWSGEPYPRAIEWFHKLKMHQTAQRNGVLIYVVEKQHRFAVVGDTGIHAKVGQDFWDQTAAILTAHFKEHRFADGLCSAIAHIGKALAAYFPYDAQTDRDELSNDISSS